MNLENVCIVSLGCAKNLTDSEVMTAKLKEAGYNIINREDKAEIIIVNTCCFIDSAKQESIDVILEVNSYREHGVLKTLIVSGCMGERYKQEILNEMPEVDGVCGTGDFENIVDIIKKIKEKRGVYVSGCMNAALETSDRVLATPFYTAYLKIAEGCDNHCTYCVIPSIRGKYRSRPKENIVKEAERLAKQGVRELVIIAQDTSCYGKDLENGDDLSSLLNDISKTDGVKWIRVHYMYPEEITDKILEEFKNNEKILKYFDIPIQHISDRILKKMGRRTTGGQIKDLIRKIRNMMPEAVIRTSLIVGFPGETEEDFSELIDFVREFKLERAGVFPYSCEEGTPASKFECQISEEIKNERYEKLSYILGEITEDISNGEIGKEYTVLIEGYDSMAKMYFGRSYKDSVDVDPKVFVNAEKGTVKDGDFVRVRIIDHIDSDLVGEIIV